MAVQYESYKFPCVLTTVSANFYEKPITERGTENPAVTWVAAMDPPITEQKMHHNEVGRATNSPGNAPCVREHFFPDPGLHLNFELIILFLHCSTIPTGTIGGVCVGGGRGKTTTRNLIPPDQPDWPGQGLGGGHN